MSRPDQAPQAGPSRRARGPIRGCRECGSLWDDNTGCPICGRLGERVSQEDHRAVVWAAAREAARRAARTGTALSQGEKLAILRGLVRDLLHDGPAA